MASALHSRHLLTTDLEQQAEDSAKQLAALRMAEELGLETDHDIQGECLELYIAGEAETVATLIQRLHEKGIYITWVTPESEAEQCLLTHRVFGMTEIGRVYH